MLKIINNSQMKVIKEILNNPGINLRTIIEKTKLSPNFVLKYVNFLVETKIINEEKLEKKRVYLRRFFINSNSNLAKNLLTLIKEQEKEDFYKKYSKFKPVFNQIIEFIKGSDFLVVYGSYARLSAGKDSDLDLLFVGKIKNKEKIRELLVSLDIEASIKIETLADFKKRISDDLHQQILKDNILVYDSEKFVDMILKC